MDAIQTFLWTLLVGMFSGIATAVLGYLKSHTTESFHNEKFIATVIWGACIGILMGYFGLPYDQAYQFLVSMGFVTLIDQSAKAIYRKYIAWQSSRKASTTTTTTTTMKAPKSKKDKKKKKEPVVEAKKDDDDSDEDNPADDDKRDEPCKDEPEAKKEEAEKPEEKETETAIITPSDKPTVKEMEEFEEAKRKERIDKMKAEFRAKIEAKEKEESAK